MNRVDDVRQKNKELYERLVNTPNIDGTFTFNGFGFKWERNCKAYLIISWSQIDFCIGNSSPFHWHPDFDYEDFEQFYEELVEIGKKGNILVVGNCGLYQSLFFIGSTDEYLANEKLKNKKYIKYYFGDENDIAKIK